MAKRQLHQLRVRSAHPSRKLGNRKQVIPSSGFSSNPTDAVPTNPITGQDSKSYASGKHGFWRWSLVWLFVVLILAGTGVVGALLLTTLPPPTDCNRMSPLTTDGERLYCAQAAAQSGKLDQLVAAINLVSVWPENHPLYSEAQRKMEQWSQAVLAIARQKMSQGDVDAAFAIARKIPVNSPLYPEAQAKIADWQQDWRKGEKIAKSVEQALREQNWLSASKQAQALLLLNMEYWRSERFDELMKQVDVEKQAILQLQEAQEIAKSNNPIDLDRAIALAGKVNPKSLVREKAQVERDKWSRALVQIAAERFKQKDFTGVVVVLQRIPTDSSVYKEAQDWIRLSRAQYVAGRENVLAFSDALWAVRQISPKSPLYKQAQAQQSLWKSHLQDNLQLQFANAVASLNQPLTYQLAIDQAQMVAPRRPGRIQAQTLIAYWRSEIQQITDRSILAEARQLANPGTIESLKAAVGQATKVELGEPLRVEAQTAIAQWTRQIETIEDQPILDLSRAFAQKGDLIAAVQSARQIRPGRALHPQAQEAINSWVAEIQIAQDQPILTAAAALAEQGRLSGAIQTAAQISAGRPLYQEARNAIARWQTQLDATLVNPAPVTPSAAPKNNSPKKEPSVDTN